MLFKVCFTVLTTVFCGSFARATLSEMVAVFVKPSTSKAPLQTSVRFDNSYYSIDLHGEILTYSDGTRTYKLPAKKCDQAVIENIVGQYRAMIAGYKARKPAAKTEFDVEVTEGDSAKIEIMRGSNLGTWLRDMPKKIMYYAAEAKVACAKK